MPEDIFKYLKPPEAAAYLNVSTSTLAKLRVYAGRPQFPQIFLSAVPPPPPPTAPHPGTWPQGELQQCGTPGADGRDRGHRARSPPLPYGLSCPDHGRGAHGRGTLVAPHLRLPPL